VRLPAALLAILVVCAAWDVFRIGFFADDFHFLDIARRIPLQHQLLGQYGIWPWYRPLSRELFFWLLVHAGPLALPAAHLASLFALWGAALALLRLGERLAPPPAAVIAPVLFVTYAYTKFLTAWASGFQDLLAIVLTLWAVLQQSRGHTARALALAALAPFAKETGFLAGPLVIAWAILCDGERRIRPWMLAQAAVTAAAALVHVWARRTWTMGGRSPETETATPALAHALGHVLSAFLTIPAVVAGLSLALAALGFACVKALLRSSPRPTGPARPSPDGFLALAAAAGLSPMLLGHALSLTATYAYQAFPALPWISLAVARLARRVPLWILSVTLGTLAALNVTGLAYRTPESGDPALWDLAGWDWTGAIRSSEVSRRLTNDLRSLFPSPPESLVVLYARLPSGSRFQTEDGPATREALRAPTARAWLINGAPLRVTPGRFAIVACDDETGRLRFDARDFPTMVNRAATSLMVGRPFTALAWALNADSLYWPRFELAFVRAGALLLTAGPAAHTSELAAAGLADSTGAEPERKARAMFGDDPGLVAAYEGLLRQPRTARAYAALGESLLARGITVDGGVALRLAAGLDPSRLSDRLRLAALLVAQDEREAARAELRIVARGADPGLAARAAEELAALKRTAPGARSR
jgi:hypothetical protein